MEVRLPVELHAVDDGWKVLDSLDRDIRDKEDEVPEVSVDVPSALRQSPPRPQGRHLVGRRTGDGDGPFVEDEGPTE